MTELETAQKRIAKLESELAAMRATGVPVALLVRKKSWPEGQWDCAPKGFPDYGCQWTDERIWVYTHPSPPEGMAGWISVDEQLPEWAARDDTPCFINGKSVPPTLTSETVLVVLKGGGVRTDKLTTIEGKSAGWWHTYGERVIAWQKTPAPPLASEAKEPK